MAVTTVRDDALTLSTDLAQAGAVFNDSTRLLDGGLWDTPADSNNQIAYLGMYTTDIHAVLSDINGMLANPGGVTVGGAALNLAGADTAVLTQVQGQLQTLLTLANGSVGNSANAATNQELIHTTQTSILNEVNGDATLANALAATGATYMGGTGATNVGFQALPTGADDAASLAAASGANATLAQIGNVFNAATDLAVGGLNTTNLTQFNTDMQAIATGLTNLINNPTALAAIEKGEAPTDAALTTIHLDTVLDQINTQMNTFDAEYATNPNVAARSTNDNLLDIIDIVQGDAAANTAAGGNGNAGNVGGFSEMPAYLSGTITKFQDDQAQTNFWAKFVAEGNVINNQLDNVAAGHNTTSGELQALITEIQNYQSTGAAFDHSQGGIFGARFDNELLGGTLNADTANAVHGLQGIMNGDTGAALAADQAQIQAAGQGFVADANDVSGNNIPLGGGTYVGTATTVAGATSVAGVATGTIPVDGTAMGGGDAGQGAGGVVGGGAAAAVTTVRDDALATSTDLAQAGAVYNDATRLLDGGLWATPASSNNQIAYLGMYTTDIHSVLNDVTSMLANPGGVTVGGAALNLATADTAVLSQVQGQLQTLLTLANGSVGNSATATTDQELIHTTQTSILNEINGDATLANALAATGATYMGGTGATNVGFQALPTGADDAASLAAASGANATLAQIGNVFNAATDLAVGGLNTTNLTQFNTDMQAIATGLTNLINNPTALAAIEKGEAPTDAALTTIHLDTVLDQINTQMNTFDAEYATNPNVAARSTNDNLLDIIDIVQGDAAANTAAGGNGNAGNVGGFSEMPAYLSGTITKFQDDQAQTNFWAKFVAEGNVINNQLDNVAAGHNTTSGELQALITEIQNYQSTGAAFDHSQGGIFGARFDNELLGGTLNADTANAVHGLQGIMNGDTGAALAADQAQIQAAGQGFVADANDVSGNNIPLGGGTYVGTATTVAGATSVAGVATGTIPVDGTAMGGGDAGQGAGGVVGGGAAAAVTTVRDDALATSTDLAQAGAVYNDATRLLDGGLWATPASSNNQIAYLGMYTTDIHSVLNDVTSMLANPGGVTVGGAALNLATADTAVLSQVQGQLQTLLTLANGSVGNSATATTDQELIHTTQTSILNEINGDATLANALAATGATYMGGTGATNVGFQALPTGADDAASLAAASGANATLAQIGNVFNAATDLAVGGLNTTNLTQFNTDMQAISAGLTNLINNPAAIAQIEHGLAPADAALTTIHLDTVLDQINLQMNTFDAEYATNPNVAARSTNDNLLDIIDIVQGDAAANTAAGGNGTAGNVGGFSEMPAYLSGTITKFQDDQAQTNFWAKFVAEGNVINNQLDNVAAGHNTTSGELQALITEIQNYQSTGAAFDHSQGGIFGARFDNELLGGTLNADTANAVHGLQGIMNGDTGAALAADQAQIQAAGQGFVADANDVSGNNIPLGGGTYVGTATTVAGATSVAGVATGTIPVDGTATGTPGPVAQGGGGNGGQGAGSGQGAGGNGGQGAQGAGGNNGGQGDPCHSQSGGDNNSADHGNHGGQQVPTFWSFVETELTQHGFSDRAAQQFVEAIWHHA